MKKKQAKPTTDPRLVKAIALAQARETVDMTLKLLEKPFPAKDVDYPYDFLDAITEEVFRLLREIGEGK